MKSRGFGNLSKFTQLPRHLVVESQFKCSLFYFRGYDLIYSVSQILEELELVGSFEEWMEFVQVKLDRICLLTQLMQKHEESKSQNNLNGYENQLLTLAFQDFSQFQLSLTVQLIFHTYYQNSQPGKSKFFPSQILQSHCWHTFPSLHPICLRIPQECSNQ